MLRNMQWQFQICSTFLVSWWTLESCGMPLTVKLSKLLWSAWENVQRSRPRSGVTSRETLENREESRAAKLSGNSDRSTVFSRKIRTLPRRKKESHFRGLAEDVESCLNANDLRPDFRALTKLLHKSTS